jgi:hypothetical protein
LNGEKNAPTKGRKIEIEGKLMEKTKTKQMGKSQKKRNQNNRKRNETNDRRKMNEQINGVVEKRPNRKNRILKKRTKAK